LDVSAKAIKARWGSGYRLKMKKLRDIDYAILSELLQNSKTSDRQLAKKLGVSQPTVTRRRASLEAAGIIREYTFIPEFTKLGYHVMVMTFLKYKKGIDQEEVFKARKKAREVTPASPFEMILGERGMGLGFNGVTISFHKNLASYFEYENWLRQWDFIEAAETESFLISLDDKVHYRPLTFSTLAKHLLKLREQEVAQPV